MKDCFLMCVVCIFLSINVQGQISTREQSVSFNMDITSLKTDKEMIKIIPSIDIEKIQQEDMEDDLRGIPPRFGYRHKVPAGANL